MMAYQAGYVVSVVNTQNKPIREFNEGGRRVARVPFGSEYKLRIQNKLGKRAKVSIDIDGMNIDSQGRHVVLGAYQTVDLERFLDSLTEGKRFKFVEAGNGAVQDPTSKENGKITVTFLPEYVPPRPPSSGILRGSALTKGGGRWQGSGVGSVMDSMDICNDVGATVYSCNTNMHSPAGEEMCRAVNDAGATVAGAHSDQKFQETSETFITEAPVVIEIWMKGPSVERHWHFNTNPYGQVDQISYRNNIISGWNNAFTVSEPDGQYLVVKIPMNQTVSTGSGSIR